MTEWDSVNREGDLVLIHHQEKPAVYGRIEDIKPDSKKDWYQVTLLLLTIPAQNVTWILREEYINGTTFTMGGEPMRLDKVKRPAAGEEPDEGTETSESEKHDKPAKVIPFKKQLK